MSLPERRLLTLSEAAQFVADKTSSSLPDAKAAIVDAAVSRQIWAEGLSEGPRIAEKSRKDVDEYSWRHGPINWQKSHVREFEQVEIDRTSLSRWLNEQSDISEKLKGASTATNQGRPIGSGSLSTPDAPLVAEMKSMVAANPSLSWAAAAKQVVHRASGGGTIDSKIKRLVRTAKNQR